ncbi:MAG: zinc-binding alcohol dehydrogenase [Vicinamibacterales bacterium]
MSDGYTRVILKSVYHAIPDGAKPLARQWYGYVDLRGRAVASRRTVCSGHRVEFLDFEIAYLEPYEFLSPGPDEVLVDARATLVSPGTERAVLCGLPGVPRGMFPFPPGYSAVGTVTQVGRRLPQFRNGQRVAGRLPHASTGIMTAISLFAVPDGVADDEASFIELGIITLQGIRRAGITPGHAVAVVGQGLIGQLSNRLARVCGAARVIGVASSRNRADHAVQNGSVDQFVALNEKPVLRDLQADVVIEAVGTPGAVMTAVECARDGGTVVLLGSARGLGRDIDLFNAAQRRGVRMIGAHISVLPDKDVSPGRYTYEQEGQLFLELLRAKRLTVADLITWRVSPADCNAVYEVLARGGERHVGIMFDWAGWRAGAAAATA